MELAAIFSTAFLVGFSGAMMPGPLLTVTIGESARRGFIAGPMIVLGHAILEVLLVVALALGLAALLTAPVVAPVIALIGGTFLVYMGWTMARDARAGKVDIELKVEEEETMSGGRRLHPVWAGVLISLSNPYWSLWWATVGLGYITLSLKRGVTGLSVFFTGHILADLVWYCLVAAAVAGSRRLLKPNVYRGILVLCGLFLIWLGGYFVYYGISGQIKQ